MGAMPPEDAMQKYVDILTKLFPPWATGGADKTKSGDAEEHSSDSKGPMGPGFSSFIHEEESGVESKTDAIHAFAREGDVDNLLKCIENAISVNLKDVGNAQLEAAGIEIEEESVVTERKQRSEGTMVRDNRKRSLV